MTTSFASALEASRQKLLGALLDSEDVTFLRTYGNLGDELIYAGTRQLLSGRSYREASIRALEGIEGETAIISGGGCWCEAFHSMPEHLARVEQRFHKVIVFPSSFEVSSEPVRRALSETDAHVFARERESYRRIENLCNADLAFDCAFFFDYSSYTRDGRGTLDAFRTDRESGPFLLPADNRDISLICETLDEWLWTIARARAVRTDRAHVTIAAALLGKQVRYRSSSYHKVPGIVDYSLGDFPVEPLDEDRGQDDSAENTLPRPREAGSAEWLRRAREAAQEIVGMIPAGASFVLVDGNHLGHLDFAGRRPMPLLERGGLYWGAPEDDEVALRELHRLLEAKPWGVILAWSAFWWGDAYPGLFAYLREEFECVLESDLLIAFRLPR